MKMEIKIVPTDMNEAQKILAALSGFDIAAEAAQIKDGPTEVTFTEPEPASEGDLGKPTVDTATDPDGSTSSTTAPAFADLTLGTERDSAQRLWCAEINSSNKATKADNTFKRKPRIDDAYYDEIVALLDAEAAEHRASLDTQSDDVTIASEDEQNIAAEPTPAPAPTPEPQREIVAYTYQGNEYTKEQLLSFPGWNETLIAQHCEPVYAEPAPAPTPAPVTGDVDRESIRKQMMSVTNKGLAKTVRDVVTQITPEGTPNMNDIPDSELARFAAILNKAEANAEALKAGTMVVEQLLNG